MFRPTVRMAPCLSLRFHAAQATRSFVYAFAHQEHTYNSDALSCDRASLLLSERMELAASTPSFGAHQLPALKLHTAVAFVGSPTSRPVLHSTYHLCAIQQTTIRSFSLFTKIILSTRSLQYSGDIQRCHRCAIQLHAEPVRPHGGCVWHSYRSSWMPKLQVRQHHRQQSFGLPCQGAHLQRWSADANKHKRHSWLWQDTSPVHHQFCLRPNRNGLAGTRV